MTEKQIPKIVAMLVEHQGCFKDLPTEDAQWVIQNTPDAIALMVEAISARNKNENKDVISFLKLIAGSEALTLDAVDGTEVLSDAKDVFSFIDSDLKNWNADEKGVATKETPVNVYEMIKDGTFADLFSSLNVDVEKLFFTQAQIKNFVKKYPNWLRTDGYATFFAFKSKGKRFVAHVRFDSDGSLKVDVYRFAYGGVWYAKYRNRFVIPQLAEA